MSHRIHTPRPFSAATALLALIVGFALTLVASPAVAHDELIGSSPAAGSEVDALPAEITLTFSGVLIDGAGTTQIVVTDASGADITGGDPVLDGTKVTQPLAASAAPGLVTVVWRVVSSDGHPVSDQFTFTVAGGSGASPEASASASSPAATSSAAVAPTGTAPSPTESAPADDAGDGGLSPAVWIGAGVAIFAALIAVFTATSAAKRRRTED
ncbi:copper resistance protein CopC [Microbacterium lacticum]|uniref:copper resistance CopC family protein n=1 Tax=Microbacterium lacticum TaxID=33885 RepID=UPI001F573DFA|nr:copper resistance protein CopC [Microbacterium lacticum]